jgi:outer membrane receptor protein involved in Fe transport
MIKKPSLGRILFSGASIAAIGAVGFISPAIAQEASDDDEIVVTATGRAAVLQEVPIAVTALNTEQLDNAGVQDIRDVTVLTPSYRFFTGQSNSAGTTASIRGVGTGGDNPGFESAVGFFIDGVYRNRSGVALSELPEVQRIEVLRGPQGTLFGRNTTSGAISVVTAGPEFNTRVFGEIEAGNLGYLSATGGITGPLSDSFAVRLEGNIQARDGYINDVNTGRDINDRNRWFVRGQALWDITPDATLRIIADVAQTDEECCTAISIVQGAPAAAVNTVAGAQGLVGMVAPRLTDGYNVALSPNRTYGEAVDEHGISAQLDWSIGGVNVTSISSYRNWEATRDQDIDFSGIDRAYRDNYFLGFETLTQELRFQGEAGPLNWLVGGFYAQEDLQLTDTIRIGNDGARYVDALAIGLAGGQLFGTFTGNTCLTPPLPPGVPGCLAGGALAPFRPVGGQGQVADNWATDTTSWSLFTHNEISLSDRLTWTVGVRYNNEEKEMTGNLLAVAPACNFFNSLIDTPGEALLSGIGPLRILVCNPVLNTQSNGVWRDSTTENEWSGTTSLRFQLNRDFMTYASYSRGYKAGGYNLDRSGFNYSLGLLTNTVTPNTNQLQFAPEFVDAYEVGLKSTILDGRGTFNVTLFRQEISDYQLNAFSGFNFIVFNVPEALTQGVEVDASLRATDNLTLTAAVAYNDATYESTLVDSLGITQVRAGTPFTTPEWNVTGSMLYEVPVSDDWTAKFYLNGSWVSDYRTATLNRDPRTDQEAFALLNGRIGLANANGLELELWGENLTDEYYYVGSFNVPEQTGNIAVYPSVPRTWGVRIRADF